MGRILLTRIIRGIRFFPQNWLRISLYLDIFWIGKAWNPGVGTFQLGLGNSLGKKERKNLDLGNFVP